MIREVIDNFFQDSDLSGKSKKWLNWKSQLSPATCFYCMQNHGKIIPFTVEDCGKGINAHKNCKCILVPMRIKRAGTATDMGKSGPEVFLIYFKKLPDYYVTKKDAKLLGWKEYLGNLHDVLPGKVIGGEIYMNHDGKLPMAPGRIWYEADINYDGGYRNRDRILFSNDGLLFASYDHYQTFHEITN